MSSNRRQRAATQNGGPPTSRSLRGRLFDDEDVVLVARPSRLVKLPWYVLTLGLYGLWRKRDESVLTDQRILLGSGILRRTERSIPLGRVDDVSVARRAISSYLTLDERGRRSATRIGPMTQRSARRFAKEVQRRR